MSTVLSSLFALCVHASTVTAPPPVALTLQEAVGRAELAAPDVMQARARLAEARGRADGVAPPLADNPTVELGAGLRPKSTGLPVVDVDGVLGQGFELGGQQAARQRGARADVVAAEADVDDVLRAVRRRARAAFAASWIAVRREQLAAANVDDAQQAFALARARARAGDVAAIDTNLARGLVARALAALADARASRAAADAAVKALVGLDEDVAIVVDGALDDVARAVIEPAAGATLASLAAHRADVRELDAALDAARADLLRATGESWPDVEATLGAARDDGDPVFSAGLRLALPTFARGQGDAAAARARIDGLLALRAARARVAALELSAARAVRAERLAALAAYDDGVVAGALDNGALVRAAYAAGEIGFGDVLVVQREANAVQVERLERLAAALDARFAVEEAMGDP